VQKVATTLNYSPQLFLLFLIVSLNFRQLKVFKRWNPNKTAWLSNSLRNRAARVQRFRAASAIRFDSGHQQVRRRKWVK